MTDTDMTEIIEGVPPSSVHTSSATPPCVCMQMADIILGMGEGREIRGVEGLPPITKTTTYQEVIAFMGGYSFVLPFTEITAIHYTWKCPKCGETGIMI